MESDPTTAKQLLFRFNGTVGGYYAVYIVNSLLTGLTFGIYSAWAKVRNKRFFYGNTTLAGHALDFDASPLGILIARIILVAILLLLQFGDTFYDLFWNEIGYLSTLVIFLFPILVVRGRAFNARHTLYKGVRFNYARRYGPSFFLLFLLLLPALAGLFLLTKIGLWDQSTEAVTPSLEFGMPLTYLATLALGVVILVNAPFHLYLSHKIKINQLALGKAQMHLDIEISRYLFPYSILVLLFLPLILSIPPAEMAQGQFENTAFILLLYLPLYAVFLGIMTPRYISAIKFADDSRLHCNISAVRYVLLVQLPNFLMIIASLGILLPLARVRKWRALTEATAFVPSPRHTAVMAGESTFREAFADAAGDQVDAIDVDFGVI